VPAVRQPIHLPHRPNLWSHFLATVVYFGIRRRDHNTGAIEAIGFAAFYSLEPFFLITFIGLSAFVWMALLLLIVTQWFPYSLGSASSWIDSNSQFLLSLVVGLSLLTPIILHGSRVHRNREGENKPRFASSCWAVLCSEWIRPTDARRNTSDRATAFSIAV
jgi:hypothetical protein